MTIDWRTVALGAAVALAVAVPVASIGSVVLDDGSDLVFAFALVSLLGFLAGGFVAGGKRPDAPLLHGAVAALLAFVVAAAITVVLQAAGDEDISPVAILFNALLATNVGLFGGWWAGRRTHVGVHQ